MAKRGRPPKAQAPAEPSSADSPAVEPAIKASPKPQALEAPEDPSGKITQRNTPFDNEEPPEDPRLAISDRYAAEIAANGDPEALPEGTVDDPELAFVKKLEVRTGPDSDSPPEPPEPEGEPEAPAKAAPEEPEAAPKAPETPEPSEDTAEKRIKDAQTAMHKATVENAQLRRQVAILQQMQQQQPFPQQPLPQALPHEPELTAEQLQEMLLDDPAKYTKYMEERQSRAIQAAEQRIWSQLNQQRQQALASQQAAAFDSAARKYVADKFPDLKDDYEEVDIMGERLMRDAIRRLMADPNSMPLEEQAFWIEAQDDHMKVIDRAARAVKEKYGKRAKVVETQANETRERLPANPVITPGPAAPSTAAPEDKPLTQAEYIRQRQKFQTQTDVTIR